MSARRLADILKLRAQPGVKSKLKLKGRFGKYQTRGRGGVIDPAGGTSHFQTYVCANDLMGQRD